MPSLAELVRSHTDLQPDDVAWLQLLQADWQIIADLSFADLVLWLPDQEGSGFWAAGQMRPTTGPTAYVEDVVGTFVPTGRRALLDQAYTRNRLVREGDPEWRDDVPVRVESIPVPRAGRVIAVVTRNTNLLGIRTPSQLELTYLQSAADLTQMIAGGRFPVPGPRSDHADTPRVGDGFLRLDAEGRVVYASPNGTSVFRRLGHSGDLTGRSLAEVARELVPARQRGDEEALSAVLGASAHRDTEVGNDQATLIVRAIPLRPTGERIGGLVLVRDVTDLRRRERELVSKDATIREIHHRVKNNLQTIASLLRLQGRRLHSEEAKAALQESVLRIGSIALVHETLSETADATEFGEVARRIVRMVGEGLVLPERSVEIKVTGSTGPLIAEIATPLAVTLTELLQNAVEHGFPEGGNGTVAVELGREGDDITVVVWDDGVGMPQDVDADGAARPGSRLGLQIVRSLVEELGGTLTITVDAGTRAELRVPRRE